MKKLHIILLSLILISIPSTYAMLDTWLDIDCDTLGSPGMIPICNDINNLNDRLILEENEVELSFDGLTLYSINYLVPANGQAMNTSVDCGDEANEIALFGGWNFSHNPDIIPIFQRVINNPPKSSAI